MLITPALLLIAILDVPQFSGFRSQFCKFGVKVAELVATLRPMPA